MKKEIALNKIHEALALLEEAFKEENEIFNTVYTDIEKLKEITNAQEEKINYLEEETQDQQQRIIYLENKNRIQEEKHKQIARILMGD